MDMSDLLCFAVAGASRGPQFLPGCALGEKIGGVAGVFGWVSLVFRLGFPWVSLNIGGFPVDFPENWWFPCVSLGFFAWVPETRGCSCQQRSI